MKENVFKRYELKYMLSTEQYEKIIKIIQEHMSIDKYGESTIQSLYYDTPNKLLIRRSIEKPNYKEKIRVRSYGLAKANQSVFLELKKKADGIVYKRRISIDEQKSIQFFKGNETLGTTQIEKEINYFKNLYKDLTPSMLIIYDRTPYYGDSELRVTFDKNIRYRTTDLDLHTSLEGKPILYGDQVLMEIKVSSAYPIWLVKILSEIKAYKTSFSKYGTAYSIEYSQKNKTQEKELNIGNV